MYTKGEMMRKVILVIMMMLLFSCNQVNNNPTKPIVRNDVIEPIIENDENINQHETCLGTWISESDNVSVIYLYEDGSFATNDISLFDVKGVLRFNSLIGQWTLENNKVTFSATEHLYSAESDSLTTTLDADLLDDQLIINHKSFKKYSSASKLSVNEKFIGEWHRTNVHQADTGFIDIKKVQDNSLFFETELYSGGNLGYITGIATFITENQAQYIHNSKDDAIEIIQFNLTDEGLEVKCTPNINNEFGHGVFIEGLYTLNDPIYTNEDIMIDVFATEERIMILKNLLGEEGFSFLTTVMKQSYPMNRDDLTYFGSVQGVGYRVYLIMTDENNVYCLTYGQGNQEVYYTNDPKGKGFIHPSLAKYINNLSNIRFVYNDQNEAMIYD